MPMPLQTMLVWGQMERFLGACRRRYGSVFTIKAAPVGTLVYISDVDDIAKVFKGDPDLYRAGEGNVVFEPVMGARSLLRIDGEEHLEIRREMLPPFHGENVRRFADLIEEVVRQQMVQWPVGEPFALHPQMHAITLEIIIRAVIGVEGQGELARFRPVLREVASLGGPLMLMWLWPGLGRFGRWRRYREVHAEAERLLFEEIGRRRACTDLAERQDVLSSLIRSTEMDDETLRDQLMTLLLAGHETTATALSWTFERLMRHPESLARLEASLASGDDEYVDAVIKEALRVRPVVFAVARKLSSPVEVGGYMLPTGTTVMPTIGLVQNLEENFDDAAAFRPERFLDGRTESYTWIPFGGGTRRCIGAPFSMFEMRIVLGSVLGEFELRAPSPESESLSMRHVTHTPGRGAETILTRRAGAERGPRARVTQAA
jgi:cytochrome P450